MISFYAAALPRLRAGLLGAGLWLGGVLPGYAQAPDPGARLAQYNQATLHEKLFVHLDRPAYQAGETKWRKV